MDGTSSLAGSGTQPDSSLPGLDSPFGVLASPSKLPRGAAVLDAQGCILDTDAALQAWCAPRPLLGKPLARVLGECCPAWETPVASLLSRAATFDQLELTAAAGAGLVRCRVETCRHGAHTFVRLAASPVLPGAAQIWSEIAGQQADTWPEYAPLRGINPRLATLFEQWPGVLFSQAHDFRMVLVSPRIEEWTGLPADVWRDDPDVFWRVIHELDVETMRARMRQLRDKPRPQTGTFRIRHKHTGRVTHVAEHRQPVLDAEGRLLGWDGIWQDITRQVLTERRLIHTSWKENLGTLTMGLAHDFCNLMTGIVSLSESFRAELQAGHPLHTGLGLIHDSATQASELARRIRLLHQDAPGEKSYQDLNEVVSMMAEILGKVISRRVRVVTELSPVSPLPVYLDPFELRQVIVNLVLNAADAMPQGGTLTLRTARHERAPSVSPVQGTLPDPPLVCFSVQDTGVGIPARLLPSIFDPFFTTKPLGKGSGLGLYNARLFAERHGAAISVESVEERGTTFCFWLAQADFTEAQTAANEPRKGRHTLLVLGPAGETLQRFVATLRQHGFYVVPTHAEAEAIEVLHQPEFQFTGLVLLRVGGEPEGLSLCRHVRAGKLPIKTFLSLTDGSQDEFNTTQLEAVDAIVPFDLPPREFVARLNTVLNER